MFIYKIIIFNPLYSLSRSIILKLKYFDIDMIINLIFNYFKLNKFSITFDNIHIKNALFTNFLKNEY